MLEPAPTIRDATTSDVTAIVALVESAYRGDPSRAGWTTEADLLDGQRTDSDEVARNVTPTGSLMLLVDDPSGGTLLACCHLQHRPDTAYFGMFAVRPGRQGGGVGRLLLEAAESRARLEWSATQLTMTVLVQRRELIEWYKRRGYRLTGDRLPFPSHDPRFGLPRRADLEFVVLTKSLG